MKKQYLIYADESHRKGKYFSNFYGGALVNYTELEKISNKLNVKKEELGLFQEVKWTKVTEQYLDKYLELIDYFFEFVKSNKIKIRIMFRQNAQVPQNLTREHEKKEYFLLYYQFIKHAFGIDYCNPNEKDQVILKLFILILILVYQQDGMATLLIIGWTLIDTGVLNLKIVYSIHHKLKIQNKKTPFFLHKPFTY